MTVPPTTGDDPAAPAGPPAERAAGEPVEDAGTAPEKPDGSAAAEEPAPGGRGAGDEPWSDEPAAADEPAPDEPGTPDEHAGSASSDENAKDGSSATGDGDTSGAPRTAARPGWSRRRRVVVAAVVVLVVLVGTAGWLAFRVYQAGRALLAAQDGLTAITQDARTRDLAGMKAALPPVRSQLDAARRAVDDPVWRAGTVLPWAGRQLGAVRTVTVALDQVVDVAGPALDAADTVLSSRQSSSGGQVALGPIIDALPPILAAADQVDSASRAIDGIDAAALTPRLAAPVASMQRQLGQVAGPLRSALPVAHLLPALLGADGPRSYLLVSLNTAELRAQGGIVGAMAVLRVDHGTISLVDQRSTADFPALDAPILPLTPAELEIQKDVLGRWIQNATMSPDFPRAAQLAAARWQAVTGQHVDGVISTDPVAAAELLKATGPVTVAGGVTLQGDTLVRQLLRDAYLLLPYQGGDNAAADAFYAQAAGAIFHAVASGQGDRVAVVQALAQAAQQGRVRIWSEHADEETALAGTGVGGAFLSGSYPNDAGVFLDDGTSGKLDYYLTTKVSVESMTCTGPNPTATVRLDLSYSPPADVASEPAYVTGLSKSGLPTGWLATNVTVYTPVGAQLGSLRLGDGYVAGTSATQDGRAVQVVTSWLAPGQQVTYRATVPVHGGSLTVWSTPTLTSNGRQTVTCGG